MFRLALDADGVIFDIDLFQLSDEAIRFFKEKYGRDIVNPNGYRLTEIFGCTEQEQRNFCKQFIVRYSLFFKPRPNVKKVMNQLREEHVDISIITAKSANIEKGKEQTKNGQTALLRLLFLTGLMIHNIHVDHIYFVSASNSAFEKAELCKQLGIDLMVDDDIENCRKINENTKCLCYRTLHNSNMSCVCEGIDSFYEIYAEVQKMLMQKNHLENIFSTFHTKTKEEKLAFSDEEARRYYSLQRKYYKALPFSEGTLQKGNNYFRHLKRFFSLLSFLKKQNIRVINVEALKDLAGNCIFVANHPSMKDTITLIQACPFNIPWHPLAKIELREGFLGIIHDALYTVYVHRKDIGSRKESMMEMGSVLTHDGNLLIFPEGTNTKKGKDLNKFSGNSVIYLSMVCESNIIPTTIVYQGKETLVEFGNPYQVEKDADVETETKALWNQLDATIKRNKQLIKK